MKAPIERALTPRRASGGCTIRRRALGQPTAARQFVRAIWKAVRR